MKAKRPTDKERLRWLIKNEASVLSYTPKDHKKPTSWWVSGPDQGYGEHETLSVPGYNKTALAALDSAIRASQRKERRR